MTSSTRSLRLAARIGRVVAKALPESLKDALRPFWRAFLHRGAGRRPLPASLTASLRRLAVQRNGATESPISYDPLSPRPPDALPAVDVSIVTFNSATFLDAFFESLTRLDYPAAQLRITAVDNGSTDDTLAKLAGWRERLTPAVGGFAVHAAANRGFGAGHNRAVRDGGADFVLISNPDVEFAPDSLKYIVAVALGDAAAACWEFRQKPFEHPKYYDPATGLTDWCAHAAILMRRSAFIGVGGYDETIFLYGEDVELSYRLRRAGWLLRYCPKAVVLHHSYGDDPAPKPAQYEGAAFASIYLRCIYGSARDVLAIPRLALLSLSLPGARRRALRGFLRALPHVPAAIAKRRASPAVFAFRDLDYHLARPGADFDAGAPAPAAGPLVSIVTRTIAGREAALRQCILSVAHQTHNRIEHIIVEDSGNRQESVTGEMERVIGRPLAYRALPKVGRSKAGNVGLSLATGQYVIFLDDDDLLFADHVETLLITLNRTPGAVAAYAWAWEADTSPETRIGPGPAFRQAFDHVALSERNFLPIQAVLFDRCLFETRGGFHEDLEILEDWNLWRRYAFGNDFAYAQKVTSIYRVPIGYLDLASRMRTHAVATEAFNIRTTRDLELIRAAEERPIAAIAKR